MQTENLVTGICIVGAGPSGATTSIFLAKMGIPHVIVDAAAFPRDKVCGDGLDLNVVRVLNHIDPALVDDEILARKHQFASSEGMRFILPNGKQVELKRNSVGPNKRHADKPIFFISKRSDFDHLLVNRIDRNFATLRLNTRIEKITRKNDRWLLVGKNGESTIQIDAGFLVGADGDHSIVLKHIGERKIDRKHYAGAVRQYWQGIEGMHPGNLIEVYFPKRFPLSYFWIFPLPGGGANVGYGMASAYIAKKNINVRKAFEELIEEDPILNKRFKNAHCLEKVKGWGIPMSSSLRKAHGDGWLLVGDAASIVCPTSGEGIGSGMISAYTAAKFIQRAVQRNDFSAKMFEHYDREIHKRLRREEGLFNLVNRLPGWLFSLGINLAVGNRFFKSWIANREMHKWVQTAYTKEIEVVLD